MKIKGKLYRVGDLVIHTIGFDDGISLRIYGKVIDIIHKKTKESFYDHYIITGYGDNNSQVDIKIKPICFAKKLEDIDKAKQGWVVSKLKNTLLIDPHNVRLIKPEGEIREIEKEIDFLNKKIDFLNKNKNRIDKLSELGI